MIEGINSAFIITVGLTVVFGILAVNIFIRQEIRSIGLTANGLNLEISTGGKLSQCNVPIDNITQLYTEGWNIRTVFVVIAGNYLELNKYKSGTRTYHVPIQGYTMSDAETVLSDLIRMKPNLIKDDMTSSVIERIERKRSIR